ncbi:MAG: phasin family protein [Wenzhouxiangellaceae bacterium]
MAKKAAKKKTAKKKVTKKTARKSTASLDRVQDNAHEIWLAGLGAFSMAQEEGVNLVRRGGKLINEQTGKVISESSKLFERLISEGRKIEGKGRKFAEDAVGRAEGAVGGVRSDVESRVGKARQQARTNWDKLEKVFEERVARALSSLGVPTSDEIQELNKRVAELNKRVRELTEAQKAAKPAPKTAAKPAAKSQTAAS